MEFSGYTVLYKCMSTSRIVNLAICKPTLDGMIHYVLVDEHDLISCLVARVPIASLKSQSMICTDRQAFCKKSNLTNLGLPTMTWPGLAQLAYSVTDESTKAMNRRATCHFDWAQMLGTRRGEAVVGEKCSSHAAEILTWTCGADEVEEWEWRDRTAWLQCGLWRERAVGPYILDEIVEAIHPRSSCRPQIRAVSRYIALLYWTAKLRSILSRSWSLMWRLWWIARNGRRRGAARDKWIKSPGQWGTDCVDCKLLQFFQHASWRFRCGRWCLCKADRGFARRHWMSYILRSCMHIKT